MVKTYRNYRKKKYIRARMMAASRYRRYAQGGIVRLKPTLKARIPGTYMFKLRVPPSTTASATNVISAHFTARTPVNGLELSSVNALFDFYRVVGIKFRWIPFAPNDVVATVPYKPLYFVYDDDADSSAGNNITSVNQALQYDNVKILNMQQPFKFYVPIPKIYQGFQSGSTNQCVIDRRGFIDIAKPCYTGDCSFYADSLATTQTYGTLVITYYVLFTERR